jgi:hypothetical protein
MGWWFDLLHDRALMPNLCACCGVHPPYRAHEVYGRHVETDQMDLGFGIRKTYGKIVTDRMRLPVCRDCHGSIGRVRRLIFSLAAAASITVCYYMYAEIAPRLGDKVEGLEWLVALLAGLITFFAIRIVCFAINRFRHPEQAMAKYDEKTGHFTFRNQAFLAAFTELNREGYCQPGSKVSWSQSSEG